ncbi:MAG TPA: aminoacetone oxidase family FAD-binding enzyme [Longimicrobiaceae bacterium]|nr:aminoacetone oxidase family FAD-binding enzyme [Longimicrobiaceae bacterium]
MQEHEVAVVGAGAAGLMAAIFAAESGARVVLLEATRDGGRKILISGGGRCNVLPSRLSPAQYVTASSPHTMKKILLSWPLGEQRRFFEHDLGIPLALEEATEKLFPVCNRARDVRDALVRRAERAGVRLVFDARVDRLDRAEHAWAVSAGGSRFAAGGVVLATGGLSVPRTGSDGLGLRLLEKLGHTVHSLYPALTPLTAEPPVHASLSGVALPVGLTAPPPGGPFRTEGAFLFTHRGYSGPAVLDISHLATRSSGPAEQPILVSWGARDENAWRRELSEGGGQKVLSAVRRSLPDRLAARLLAEAAIDEQRSLAQLRREERNRLLDLLTRYPLPWTGDEGYRKAEVTGGGVSLAEVDPVTLESRKLPGLFLCGELLDAFGPIGGYNFAWAWATGRAAGWGAARAATGPPHATPGRPE